MIYEYDHFEEGKYPPSCGDGREYPLGWVRPFDSNCEHGGSSMGGWGASSLLCWAYCELHTNIDQIGQKKGPPYAQEKRADGYFSVLLCYFFTSRSASTVFLFCCENLCKDGWVDTLEAQMVVKHAF